MDKTRKFMNIGLMLLVLALGFGWSTRYIVPASLISVFVLTLFIVTLWDKRKSDKINLNWLDISLATFLIVSLILSLGSVYFYSSLVEWMRLFTYIATFWLIVFWLKKEEEIQNLVYLIAGLGGLVSLYGLSKFALVDGGTSQIVSTFGWRNTYGGFLLLVLPLVLSIYLSAQDLRETRLFGIASFLMAISLVLTYSRASWLIFILVLLFLVFLLRKVNLKNMIIRLGILVITTASVILLLTQIGNHSGDKNPIISRTASIAELPTSSSESAYIRLALWKGAMNVALDHPLIGTGLGNFGDVYPKYQTEMRFFAKDPHNYLLKILAELGFLGFFALLFTLVVISLFLYQAIKTFNPKDKKYIIVVGLEGGILGSLLHNFVDIDFWIPAITLLFFIELGLVVATLNLKQPTFRFQIPFPNKVRYLMIAALLVAVLFNLSFILGNYYLKRGNIELGKKEFKKSIQDCEIAKRVDFFNEAPDQILTYSYLQTQNQKAAIAPALSAVSKNQASAKNHNLLGNIYFINAGRDSSYLNKAEKELRLAVFLDPVNKPEYYRDLGKYYLLQNNFDEAKKQFLTALDVFSEDKIKAFGSFLYIDQIYEVLEDIHLQLSIIYQKEGEAAKVQQEKVKAAELHQKIEDIRKERNPSI